MKQKTEYKYVRTGRCNPKACGSFCCRFGPFNSMISEKSYKTKKAFKDDVRFYEYMGCQILHEEINKGKKEVLLTHMVTCRHLKGHRCAIYKNRPAICKVFPKMNGQAFYDTAKKYGCTYQFKKVKCKRRKEAPLNSPKKRRKTEAKTNDVL